MSKHEYDRERVARLFDDAAEVASIRGEQPARCGESIPEVAGRLAFERLELRRQHVLLDVGTGTGDKATAAARICRRVVGIDISKKGEAFASCRGHDPEGSHYKASR